MPAAPTIWTDARVAGTRFGPVRWYDVIDSTNRLLIDEATRGAAEGLVAVADSQTAGRGRLGRSWVAPPGASLLVSVLLRPHMQRERWHLATLAAGLAAVAAVAETGGIDAGLKWPNDVVVEDRKLAGLLAEATGDALVVGMGLNVQWDDFPPDIALTATACNLCSDRAITRGDLLAIWLRELDARLDAPDRVLAEATDRSATLGRRVRVELADGTFEGDAQALTAAGHLVVRRVDGRDQTVSAGDVVHLRRRD